MPVYQVTAHLTTPVVLWEALHLDGVLASVLAPDHHLSRALPEADLRPLRLPVYRLDALGTWCYIATDCIWPPETRRGQAHFIRSKDAEDIELWRNSVWTPNAGPERRYLMTLPTIEASSVSWLVVGDGDGLRSALRKVSQIGAYRRQGYGFVTDWSFRKQSGLRALDVLIDVEGRARRHLPFEWVEDWATYELGSYQPPYWLEAHRKKRRVPKGARCKLRPEVIEALSRVK